MEPSSLSLGGRYGIELADDKSLEGSVGVSLFLTSHRLNLFLYAATEAWNLCSLHMIDLTSSSRSPSSR